ncbi:energy-coupling factor ABC transporter substrate-binding protein [Clostridioides mangenotii]|uniref:energy-coupling factor ABC transporter substrate-binding protein n=1 Tax=Metaclostridioides mangenotii TaxID=1540 RepID=UPI001C1100E2|nr:energy-coupling factor ABC transporter substrate-binding protein [Clostridioides mangenotii]MBU5308821.1 energy-coupling factor ABC transporter substrate-binding protein [Clostridioides mangenotii]
MDTKSNPKNNSKMKTNLILLLLVVLIAIIPLLLKSGAEFGGADGEAEDLITKINPDYEPWFSSIYEPASGEIESLLFSVQAALGAGVIGYYLGRRKRD